MLTSTIWTLMVFTFPSTFIVLYVEFFKKDFEGFVSNSVLIVGGDNEYGNSSENLFTNPDCHVPNFRNNNCAHSLSLSAGDHKVLSCGGTNNGHVCHELRPQIGQWTWHSTMTNKRAYSTAISMPNGIYIFGGNYSPTTSDFLPKSSKVWEAGPNIPGKGFWFGCGVKISNTEIVLIGGINSMNIVIKYNTKTKGWKSMPNLLQGRRHHSCGLINKRIIMSGGYDGDNYLKSTEIIPLTNFVPRIGGDLNTKRVGLGMLAVGAHFLRVLAIGGYDADQDHYLHSIEVWNDDEEVWTMAPFSLKHPRCRFGYLSLPEITMCSYIF